MTICFGWHLRSISRGGRGRRCRSGAFIRQSCQAQMLLLTAGALSGADINKYHIKGSDSLHFWFSLVHPPEPHFIPRTASEHACSRARRRSSQPGHAKSEHIPTWANQGMHDYIYRGLQARADRANTDRNCWRGLTVCCNST